MSARPVATADVTGGPVDDRFDRGRLDRGTGVRSLRGTVDVAVLVAALGLAALPLLPAYSTGAPAALIGGLTLGAAVAAVGARGRWSGLSTVAVLVLAGVLVGGPLAAPATTLAGVVPTGDTVRALLGGVVTVWKEMLTLRAPLGAGGGLLVAPYVLALAAAATAVSLALRARTPGRASAAAVVPGVVAVLAVLLGTRETLLPLATGVGTAVLLLTWASWRQGLLQPRRVLSLALVGVVAVLGGAVTGPVLAGAEPRLVLRDELTPPFDPRDHPSPLAGYRRFVKEWKDTDLLTVRGLPAGADVRLATMDAYDGVVWDVSGQGTADGSGAFRRPADDGSAGVTTQAGTGSAGTDPDARPAGVPVDVEIHALAGVWLPTVGEPQALRFAGAGAADHAGRLRLNDATGAAVLTEGLAPGLRYTVRAEIPAEPTDEEVGTAGPARVTLPRPHAVPDVVGLVARELGTGPTPVAVARALESGLVERGWFSHGLVEAGDHPSLSGHGADRMTSLLGAELMVGDSEQYASAMALMARELGLPARVVLGFRTPDADAATGDAVTFTGDDAEAWVEIAFTGHGWVAFHPTPDESRTPDDQTPQDRADPEPQVVQPPPPAPEPVTPPEEDPEQPRTDEPADEAAGSPWARAAEVVAVGLVPLAVLLLPAAVLDALRRRRRRRRRTTGDAVSRVVGGWDEVLDVAADLAVPVVTGGTRRETAADLAERVGPGSAGALTRLATRADTAVFAPGQPGTAEVEGYWDAVDAVVDDLRASVPRRRRVRSRWSTASLRRRTAVLGDASRPARRSVPTTPTGRRPGARPPTPRALVHPHRDGES